LLDESPDFGATGTEFGGELGAADHNRGVAGKQVHDAAKADVGFLARRGAAGVTSAVWDRFRDARIITSRVTRVGDVRRLAAPRHQPTLVLPTHHKEILSPMQNRSTETPLIRESGVITLPVG
jgi:hypothetical protein